MQPRMRALRRVKGLVRSDASMRGSKLVGGSERRSHHSRPLLAIQHSQLGETAALSLQRVHADAKLVVSLAVPEHVIGADVPRIEPRWDGYRSEEAPACVEH